MPTSYENSHGRNNDLVVAYVFRFIILGTLGFIVKTSMDSRDILIKGDIPQMQRDIQELKLQGQKFITQDQMNQAIRVQIEQWKHSSVLSDSDPNKR